MNVVRPPSNTMINEVNACEEMVRPVDTFHYPLLFIRGSTLNITILVSVVYARDNWDVDTH